MILKVMNVNNFLKCMRVCMRICVCAVCEPSVIHLSLWRAQHAAPSTTIWHVKVETFAVPIQPPCHCQLQTQGMATYGLGPGFGPGLNIIPHVLLEYRGSAAAGTVSLRAVAVALTTSSNSTANATAQPSVYTPGRSATAFILAMAAARSAYMTQVIFTGHLFNQHVLQVRLPCI